MSLAITLVALHIGLALWALHRSSRIARWSGARRTIAMAFAWLVPLLGPLAVLAATLGSSAGDPNLRHAVEQLSVRVGSDDQDAA